MKNSCAPYVSQRDKFIVQHPDHISNEAVLKRAEQQNLCLENSLLNPSSDDVQVNKYLARNIARLK